MKSEELRRLVLQLQETMMSASSYPGPTPGSSWSMGASFTPAARAMMFPELSKEQADKKKFKDRFAKKRDTLRKLSQWLSTKDNP